MSYFSSKAIQPTPGLAVESFRPGTHNPMIPQPRYAPPAAGPGYLDRVTSPSWSDTNPIPQSPAPPGRSYVAHVMSPFASQSLSGEASATDIFSQLVPDAAIDAAINRMWARMAPLVKAEIAPAIYLNVAGVALAGAAAVFAYMAWDKVKKF